MSVVPGVPILEPRTTARQQLSFSRAQRSSSPSHSRGHGWRALAVRGRSALGRGAAVGQFRRLFQHPSNAWTRPLRSTMSFLSHPRVAHGRNIRRVVGRSPFIGLVRVRAGANAEKRTGEPDAAGICGCDRLPTADEQVAGGIGGANHRRGAVAAHSNRETGREIRVADGSARTRLAERIGLTAVS